MWRNPHQDVGKTAERWRDLKAAICGQVTAFDARQAWYLILEGGIGDYMFVLTYLRAFRKAHGGPIILIMASGMRDLASLFADEIDSAIFLERTDLRALRATTAFARFEPGDPIVTWWPAYGDGRISAFHDWPGGLTIRDVARIMLRLAPSATVNSPVVPDETRESAVQLLAQHGLRPGRTVVLFPFANTAPRHPPAWWTSLADRLKTLDYDIAINADTPHAKVKHRDADNPTATEAYGSLMSVGASVYMTKAQVVPFVEAAGAVILTQSGIGDLLAFANARKLIISPCRRDPSAPNGLDLSICFGGANGGGSLIRCHDAEDCLEIDLPLDDVFDPALVDHWLDTVETPSETMSALEHANLNNRVMQSVLANLQQAVHAVNRPVIAEGIAKIVSRETAGFELPWPDADTPQEFAPLAKDGISQAASFLTEPQRRDVLSALRDQPVFNAHTITRSDGVARRIGEGAEDFQYGAFQRRALLEAPHLLEVVTSAPIMRTVQDYLGCLPKLYSFNAFWNFPAPKVFKRNEALYSGVQTFHRDSDDFRFLSLFIFLDGSDGDHVYFPGTQTVEGTRDLYNRFRSEASDAGLADALGDLKPDDLFRGAGLNKAFSVMTPAGTVRVRPEPGTGFLADPYGVHRGEVPTESRLLLTVRFGLYSNTSASYETPHSRVPWSLIQNRVPAGDAMRYVLDLMVDFDR